MKKNKNGRRMGATWTVLIIAIVVCAVCYLIIFTSDILTPTDNEDESVYISKFQKDQEDLASNMVGSDGVEIVERQEVGIKNPTEEEIRVQEESEEDVEGGIADYPEGDDKIDESKQGDLTENPEKQIITFDKKLSDSEKVEVSEEYDVEFTGDITDDGTYTVNVRNPEKISELEENPDVENVEIDGIAKIVDQTVDWGVERVGAPETWSKANGRGVKVAVIDTGVQAGHPDLRYHVISGYDFVNGDGNPRDDHGHGTHVAGIIGAKNNSFGTVGVAPVSRLMPVKVLNANGYGYWSDVAKGIRYAADNGAKVINMSLGGYASTEAVKDAVNYAHNKGVLVVSAAGNASGNRCIWPAAYANSMCVMATDKDNKLASFSNEGGNLSAPGVSILSTYKGGTYRRVSGTSMATPHVSGAAAAIFSACNNCTPDNVQNYLQNNALDIGRSGFDNLFGYGLLDVEASIDQMGSIGANKQSIRVFKPRLRRNRYVVPKRYRRVRFSIGVRPRLDDSDIRTIKLFLNRRKIYQTTNQTGNKILNTRRLTNNQYAMRIVARYSDGSKEIKRFVLDMTRHNARNRYSEANPENLNTDVLLAATQDGWSLWEVWYNIEDWLFSSPVMLLR